MRGILVIALLSASVLASLSDAVSQERRNSFDGKTRSERLTPRTGTLQLENTATTLRPRFAEAPTGFDDLTNGFLDQTAFNAAKATFEKVEQISDGLGPTYNAQSCRECHQNVVTGGASQIAEHRTGHLTDGAFFESQGGSLIQSRAIHPAIVEHVAIEDDIRTFRISTNTLGAGFIEAVSNFALLAIRDAQPASMRGTAVIVPVLEADGTQRIGRFGWKDQHASLESFAADAYLNEMGITSPLFPEENSSSGVDVSQYDSVPDPEDDGADVLLFANFMRSTKAPSRGPITQTEIAGQAVFGRIGCNICHTPTLTTVPPGTRVNGGVLLITEALGNKVFHPYSDLLMHDIGTSDGIPIQPTSEFAGTANMMRTAPLWGLRTRNRLMHDGLSFTITEAITRHAGQAVVVIGRYATLSDTEKTQLLAFLNSL